MYCNLCEARLRRGIRPDPTCPECHRLRSTEAVRYQQIPLKIEIAPQSERTRPEADRLHGHLVCSCCHRLVSAEGHPELDGLVFCADCLNRLPVCRNCGKRISSRAEDGYSLCAGCRTDATACKQCGELLLPSELYECDGFIFCDKCYDALEECENCGNKMFVFDSNAVTLLCPECLTFCSACEICGAVIPKEQILSAEGRSVCEGCLNMLDECEDCGQPVFALPGEIHPRLCGNCRKNYVLCGLCQEPIPVEDAGRYLVDSRQLCENCYDDLPECEECFSHFFPDKAAERGDSVCRACRDSYTHCDACGKRILFTDAYEKDGRLLCGECHL